MAEQKENRFSGMTPEEIRLEAKRQIVRSAFLALAALIVIGVACYAWFVSGGTVTAITGPVAMREQGFELASRAEGDGKGNYDKYVQYLDPTLPEGETVPAEVFTPVDNARWTKGNQTILWRVDEHSNFGNDGRKKGIRPGSEGNLSFYVIPKETGSLIVKCHLDAIPKLKSNSAGSTETAQQLLRGHLLYTYKYEYQNGEQTVTEIGNVEVTDGSFTVTLPNAQANVPQLVTLTWFWPYLLREAATREDYDEAKNQAINNTIKAWTESQDKSVYFYYKTANETRVDVTVSSETKTSLSRYYNNADQYIGDHVAAIVLQLTADLAE